MTEKTDDMGKAPAKSGAAGAKDARLKAALKANMGRRKAQARARSDADSGTKTANDADNNENE